MRTKIRFTLLLLSIFFTGIAQAQYEDYIGLWQTIDDKTNKPRSVVELSIENDKLVGKIVKLFQQAGEEADPICKECKDELLNVKVIGLQIIRDMSFKKGKWKSGEILDPDNGKFYDCKIWIEDGKLQVRGYIGFFFRTQQWIRMTNKEES